MQFCLPINNRCLRKRSTFCDSIDCPVRPPSVGIVCHDSPESSGKICTSKTPVLTKTRLPSVSVRCD